MLKKFYEFNTTFLFLQIQKPKFQWYEIQIFLSINGRMQMESKRASENVLGNTFHFINVQIIPIFFFFFLYVLWVRVFLLMNRSENTVVLHLLIWWLELRKKKQQLKAVQMGIFWFGHFSLKTLSLVRVWYIYILGHISDYIRLQLFNSM